ncbi:MAG TPA: glycosyltransferase [Bacteroidia bacterium]|nr:glycosyltransferase [Bacteroidia bacterium]HRH07377.1 glycosyltransferase [Bacteroidia bacterium]
MKKAIVSVINDLATDQRVHKTCMCLHQLGFEVVLVGRKLKDSLEVNDRPYQTKRMNLLFTKGILFYLEFQVRLFLFLVFKKTHLLVANDLDTLMPNYLISKIKKATLVYDTHEYFCYVPELMHHPLKQKTWLTLEKWIFPKLRNIITVNESIAENYQKEYGKELHVIKNVPAKSNFDLQHTLSKTKEDLGLPGDKKIVILQGAGINVNRGAEEAIEAMQYVRNAVFLIVGSGDVLEDLKLKVLLLKLENKVFFIKKLPFKEMLEYTRVADIGISLDKGNSLNYYYSLPNKLFDYFHSGIAVLASPLVEIKKIMDEFSPGTMIESHDPKHIAEKINFMLANDERMKQWKANAKLAAEKYCWENEQAKLIEIYHPFAN